MKGTPFKTIDGVTAVEDKSTAGMSIFEKAMYDFGKVRKQPQYCTLFRRSVLSHSRGMWSVVEQKYPVVYAKGLGPTTNAERWNGRHAMAGWVLLLATGK